MFCFSQNKWKTFLCRNTFNLKWPSSYAVRRNGILFEKWWSDFRPEIDLCIFSSSPLSPSFFFFVKSISASKTMFQCDSVISQNIQYYWHVFYSFFNARRSIHKLQFNTTCIRFPPIFLLKLHIPPVPKDIILRKEEYLHEKIILYK